jgi:alcohol dehydrogenase (cytochrome c)
MYKPALNALLVATLLCAGAVAICVHPSPALADAPAPPMAEVDLESTQDRLDLWVHYTRDYNGQRYSPDTQINRDNVGRLELKWKKTFKYNPMGFENTALVFGGHMYITDGRGLVKVDAQTGETVWSWYRPKPPKGSKAKKLSLPGVNRGAAVLDGRIYLATVDAHLVCIDAETGTLLWDRIVDDPRAGYQLTSAPLIVKDKVIVGISGAEFGIRGYIDAYNAKTGFREWRFWVIPGPGEPGNETWEGDSWKRGGGSAWLTGTYDPQLDILYWGTSNPAPDYDGSVRKGDNLYTNSIVAVDPDTGKLVWYFQTTPHDLFDWSGVSEPILVDDVFNGKPTRALVQANRNGYVYVLDRTNGSLISAYPFTKVNWANINAEGKPVIKPELANATIRKVFPGNVGGTNWPPKAYSSRTGLLYIPAIERGSTYVAVPSEYRRGQLYVGGVTTFEDAPAEGSIEAMDVRTGEIKWSFDTKGPNWGGLVATAGGLVFGGAFDGKLRAFNDETGEVLWEYQTLEPAYAPATTFRINGKQYIGMAAGFGVMSMALATSGRESQSKGYDYYLFGLPDD